MASNRELLVKVLEVVYLNGSEINRVKRLNINLREKSDKKIRKSSNENSESSREALAEAASRAGSSRSTVTLDNERASRCEWSRRGG